MKKSFCLLTLLFFNPLTAQIISVKTYPVLSDESMFSYPSRYHAMGNVDIALPDEVKNPFVNPAALLSMKRVAIFFLPRRSSWTYERESNATSSPTYTSKSINKMSASNFATQVGVVSSSGFLALAVMANYQRMRSNDREEFSSTGWAPPATDASFGATNTPFQIGAALRIPWLEMNVGAQYSYVDVNGIDGIQFLYPSSKSISVKGRTSDMRMGISGALFSIGSYEALAGTARLTTTQTAQYEGTQPPVVNNDENNTRYLQLNYRLSLSERMQLGFKALANWKDLPQLPNYPIAGIPRDPGTITAYNFGAGMSWRTSSSTLLALEYLYEPIQTNTWVAAQADRDLGNGRIFPKGAREQENNYSFSNHIVRGGVEIAAEDWLSLRFGSEIHSYQYNYYNKNFIWNSEQTRTPQTLWTELRMSGSATVSWGNFEFSYLIESMQGRGLLEQRFFWPWINVRALASDFLIVPNDWLTVRPIPVVSHQFSVAYYLF